MSDAFNPAARIDVEPVAATPGQASVGPFSITNTTPVTRSWSVEVIGLDPAWVQVTPTIGPLAPGETGRGDFRVTLPLGHPPSDVVASLVVRPVGEVAGGASADVHIVVGDGHQIAARLDPPTAVGGGRARFEVILRNRGAEATRVELRPLSTVEGLKVTFQDPAPVLPPGREVVVRVRAKAPRPSRGPSVRRNFGIRIQGRTTPIDLDGAFEQRPVFGNWLTKGTAIFAVVAVWTALAVVGISTLSHRLSQDANNKSIQNSPLSVPTGPAASAGHGAPTLPAPTKPAAPAIPGKSATGSKTSGTALAGSSGTATGSTLASAGSSAQLTAAPTETVTGKVSAPDPSGVTVTISPTSLVDEQAQGANFATSGQQGTTASSGSGSSSVVLASTGPAGKVYGSLVSATADTGATARVSPTETFTTVAGGSFAFNNVRAPGYYLVSFSKAGYQTSKYVVTTTVGGPPVSLDAVIGPGEGALSGTVLGPNGPLGDVDLTITDGTVTVHTKTPTIGAVGTWSMTGLSTPDSYLVTATLDGYSTQTAIATLGPSGVKSGLNLTMTPGAGTLTGTVISSRSGAGVGGLTVTASSGSTSLTATTTTSNPVGSYTLPNLTIPGTYALTVSGPGWLTQTQEVNLTGNATVNAAVTPSTATVTGIVTNTSGVGIPDVGMVLSNDTNTFKTLSQSSTPVGGFSFAQIPPGSYILSTSDFGYATQSTAVTVLPGDDKTVNLTLPTAGGTSTSTATIEGTVADLFNGTNIGGATFLLDNVPTTAVSQSNGNYALNLSDTPNGVSPGVHLVTAMASGFEPASVQVTVPLGATVFAPTIFLPILDRVGGVVLDNATGQPVPNPVVTLISSVTGKPVGTQASVITLSGVPNPAQGGFEVDDLPHGNYTMSVSAPPTSSATYLAKTGIQLTLALDTDQLFVGSQAVTLDEAPTYHVITLLSTGSTAPTYQSGVLVTMTDETNPSHPVVTGTSPTSGPDELSVGPLTVGDTYSVAYSYPATNPSYTAPTVSFTASLDNTAIDTAILYSPVSTTTSISLTFPYRTTTAYLSCPVSTVASTGPLQDCPVLSAADLPAVSVTGTTGYQVGAPGVAGSPITSSVPATPDDQGTWTLSASAASSFISRSVSVSVSEPTGISTFNPKSAFETLGTASKVDLVPVASPVSGTVTPTTGVSVAVAAQTGGVSVGASVAAGVLQFNDAAAGVADSAEPGSYVLTYSASGYDDSTATLTVGLCTTSCTPVSQSPAAVSLLQHVSLQVTLVPAVTPPTGAITANLYAGSGRGKTLLASQTMSSSSTTFTNLSESASVTQPLEVDISAFGYQTDTVSNITLGSATYPVTNGVATLDTSLTSEGWLTGKVSATIGTTTGVALAGAQVTAVDITPAGSQSCSEANPPVATTASDGTYIIAGNPSGSAGDGGLCIGDTYSVTVADAGYTPGAAIQQVIVAGSNEVDPPMTATKLPLTITVDDGSGNAVPSLTVTGLSGTAPTVSYVASGTCAPTPPTTPPNSCKTVHFSIDPTPYTFTFSAPGYATLSVGPIPYQPGSGSQTLSESMSLDKNTITGTVTTPAPGGTTTDLPGVSVTLEDSTGATLKTTTTDSNGTYTFTRTSSLTYIPDGNYQVSASLAGYTFVPPSPAIFATTYPTTVENLSMTATPGPVSVKVTNAPSVDLTGATVTLTEDPGGTPNKVCAQPLVQGLGNSTLTATVAGTNASFASVIPDVYTVTVSGTVPLGQLPPQATTQVVTVCPTGVSQSATYAVQIGEITGQVTLDPPSTSTTASGASVAISGGSWAIPNPTVSCVSGSTDCSVGSYSVLVPAGGTFTVTATVSDTGYGTGTTTGVSPNPTASPDTVIAALTHSVTVTVTSTATPTMSLPNAAVTLTNHCDPNRPLHVCTYTGTTGTAITGVVPVDGTPYQVSVTRDGVTATGSISVPVQAADPSPLDISSTFAPVSGVVTVGTSTGTVSITGGGCAASDLAVDPTTGAYGPCYVTPGTYAMSFNVASVGTPEPASITVADGVAVLEDATTVTVPVQDSSNKPLSGATVTLVANTVTYTATTDTSGNATLLVPAPDGTAVSYTGTVTWTHSGTTLKGTYSGSFTPGTAKTQAAVTAT